MNKIEEISWGMEISDDLAGNGYGYKVHSHSLKNALSKYVDINKEAKHCVIITSPEFYPEPISGKVNWLFTMFEGTVLPNLYKKNIENANYLLTPSMWVRDLLGRWFDKKRIHVVPHGIDKRFTYVRRNYPKIVPFRYLWIGAANPRKGWEELMASWVYAFGNDPGVELYVKTTGLNTKNMEGFEIDGKPGIAKRGNIIVDTRDLEDEELVKLYHDAHCFVFPTRGEGFGFTLAEAMRTGMPCISTYYSGLTDYFDNTVGYPIGYEMKPAVMNFPAGVVQEDERKVNTVSAYPDLEELVGAMWYVRHNYYEALKKGEQASSRIKKDFTWGKSARILLDILQLYGCDNEENKKRVKINTNPHDKKVLTMICYKRPEYTKQVIDNLKKCDGIERYKLFVNIEPGDSKECKEVQNIIKNIDFIECDWIINDCVLGINENTYQNLLRGFQTGADFVIHIEDDTVPAKDFLRYMEWADKKFKEDKEVFTICGYNKIENKPKGDYKVFKKDWFTPWGWGTWKDRWEIVERKFHKNEELSWDIYFNKVIREERFEIRPELGRIQNIGAKDGFFVPDEEFHRKHQYNEEWAGKYENELESSKKYHL